MAEQTTTWTTTTENSTTWVDVTENTTTWTVAQENEMGLESGTYIDSLVATNPVGSDNRNQGDDHLRLIKNTVNAPFPDVDEAVVTIHNGSSAPSNKQTGTVWRDTSASLWKYWNGSTWYVLPLAFNATSNLNISGNALISSVKGKW